MSKIAERNAHVVWKGSLRNGEGTLGATAGLDKAVLKGALRFEQEPAAAMRGTNPEELLASAHAACFAQTLAYRLTEEQVKADWLDVRAACTLELVEEGTQSQESAFQRAFGETHVENFKITRVDLRVRASISDSDAEAFQHALDVACAVCPISNALHDSVEVAVQSEHGEDMREPQA